MIKSKKSILNINSKQLIKNGQKQIDNFKSKAKELGVVIPKDISKISEYKNALNSIEEMKLISKITHE